MTYPCVGTTTKTTKYCNRKITSYDVTTHKCGRTVTGYEFKAADDTNATECKVGSSFNCDSNHNGNSYVSSCVVTQYTCSNDSTLSAPLCYAK